MKNVEVIIKLTAVFLALVEAASADRQIYKDLDGRQYLIETEAQYDWFAAFKVCKKTNNQFIIIDSEKKNEAIIDLLGKYIRNATDLWLGGHDDFSPNNDDNRPFFWSATGESFQFNYWSNSSPGSNEKGAHCVHMSNSTTQYRWKKANCKTKMGFMCEVISKKGF